MAELDLAAVGLVPKQQILLEPGRVTDAQQQQTFGHGIEGSGMADATLAERLARHVDHVVRGRAGLFEDRQQARENEMDGDGSQ